MCKNNWRHLLLVLLWITVACSELLQETCVNIDGVALKGQEFTWVTASGDTADISSCQYTDTGTHFLSQAIPFPESPSSLNSTGLWNFQCTDGNSSGTVSVVSGLHIISVTANVPHDCYAVGIGDVVLWLVDEGNQTCEKNIIVESDSGVEFTSNLTGKQSHYQFTKEGEYYLKVTNLPSVTHTIVVVQRDIVNITNDHLQQQCASVSRQEDNMAAVDCDECVFNSDVSEGLLFSHASIMSVSFGILMPVGALLAANGSPFAHKIVQPGGIILSLVGYGLVLAYIEVEEKSHFNTSHSVVGFFLVLLIFLMPFMRLRRELHYIHKKCGVVIVFYGMTNVLLGLVTAGCAPVYAKSVYGVWLVLTIVFYVFWKNSKDHKKRGIASNDESWSGCYCFQPKTKSKNLEVPINIRRLSRNVIDEDKFVTLRDISEEELHRLAVTADPRPAVPMTTTVSSSEQQPPMSTLPHHVVTRSDSLRVTRHSERAKDYDPITGTFKGTTPSPNLIATERVTAFDHLSEHSDEEDYSEEMRDKFNDSNDNVFAESPVRMRNGGAVGSAKRRHSSRSRTRANTLPVDFEQSWELHKHRRFESLSSGGEAILCADRKGNITYWGDGAVKMFGYTPNEALGCSLKMLMPSEYQERHQNGLDRNTQSTMKYLRKHQYAPEFQKHARLYEVKALSKNGEKFPVEVNLSSFVVDEEIYYAAILRDMSQPGIVSTSSVAGRHSGDKELRIKKKALLVGATMKFTHNLTSPEYITKEELRKVMSDSLNTAHVETGPEQIDKMINDIVKAGGRSDNEESISYLDLLKILSQHGLHVKESGLIGRHSKQNRVTIQLNWTERIKQFFVQNCVVICWLLGYLILNIVLYLGVSLSSDAEGWKRWAIGSNTVLCMNFFLIILPVLRSILDSFHSHTWLSKVLPLSHRATFHLVTILGIFFWCAVHVTLHLCSYAIDTDENSTSNTTDNAERLRNKLEDDPQSLITGGLIVLFLLAMTITSIKRLQVSFNFILFYTIHFISSGSIYLLIFIHGPNFINSQFWKWLIPTVFLWIFEWLYRRYSNKVQKVNILEAYATGNMVIYKVAKPNLFKFVPGQFLSVKFPDIGPISWNRCEILSAPSDKFLRFVVENKGCWGNKIYKTIFAQPYNAPVLLGDEHYAKAYLTGPYGAVMDIFFDYKCSLLVCEDDGLFAAHSILTEFTQHIVTHKVNVCNCGCAPSVTKLFFIWVSRNRSPDHQWFVDFLTEIIEGGAMPTMVDARVYFTDSETPPDDLAALMLNLGLAMSETQPETTQPKSQLRRKTSTGSSIKPISVDGVPDFEYILQGIQAQNLAWEVGVFSLGDLHATLLKDLKNTCSSLSESAQSTFEFHQIMIKK